MAMQQTMTAAQYRARVMPSPARRAPHAVGKMNGLESEYLRTVLEPRREAGEILEIQFEGLTLRMANRTGYTPDFVVVTPHCIELHEVKGHWEDDARVKWKVAGEQFWCFRLLAVTKRKKSEGGGFNIEEYGA